MATQRKSTKNIEELTPSYDWSMLAIIVTLLFLGIIMVFSASFAQGFSGYDDPYFFIKRQLMWAGAGIVVMIVASRIPYDIWQRWSVPLMAVGLVSLLAVVILGTEVFGATRTFFGGSVQPSEPAKIIIIIYVSAWLASKGERIRQVQVGLIPFSVLMGAVTVLVVTQPDISTAILIVTTASVMFFIAGAEMKQLLMIAVGGAATFWLVIRNSTYAAARLAKYQESLWNPLESAEYQVQRAVEALTLGGPFGHYRRRGWHFGRVIDYLPLCPISLSGLEHSLASARQFWYVVGNRYHVSIDLAGHPPYSRHRRRRPTYWRYPPLYELWGEFIINSIGCSGHLAQYLSTKQYNPPEPGNRKSSLCAF